MTEENPYRIELWGDSVESIRSFDVLSQRSVENLDEIAIYPATELMLSEARRQDGFARIKKETKQYAKKLREQGNPEAAHRIETQIKEIEESAQEFGSVVNLESFVHYFYPRRSPFWNFSILRQQPFFWMSHSICRRRRTHLRQNFGRA